MADSKVSLIRFMVDTFSEELEFAAIGPERPLKKMGSVMMV